jgi:hypothetical protein
MEKEQIQCMKCRKKTNTYNIVPYTDPKTKKRRLKGRCVPLCSFFFIPAGPYNIMEHYEANK